MKSAQAVSWSFGPFRRPVSRSVIQGLYSEEKPGGEGEFEESQGQGLEKFVLSRLTQGIC